MTHTKTLIIILCLLSLRSYSQVPSQDSLALVSLYQATGGNQWTDHTNWLQTGQPVANWFGVEIAPSEPHYVTSITLPVNNLTGQLPADIGNLSHLENLILSGNHLSGDLPPSVTELRYIQLLSLQSNNYTGVIPALLFQIKDPPSTTGSPRQIALSGNHFSGIDYQPSAGYNLLSLSISNNDLDFGDIQPLLGTGITSFAYTPQRRIYTSDDLALHEGAKLTLKTETGGSANHYQWKRNNAAITNATATIYTTTVQSTDDGAAYTASVTSTAVPNLTLERNPITLHISGRMYRDCNATTHMLEAGTTDPQATFAWSTGETTRTITASTSGKYGVRIETPNYIAEDTVEILLPATLDLGPDINSCQPSVTLVSNVTNADTYTWQTPSGTVSTPTVNATVNGEYTLTVISGACQKTDAISIIVGNITEGTFSVAAGTIPVDDGTVILAEIPITFTNTTGSGGNYTWTFGDLGTAQGDDAVHSYARPGSYTVKLTGTDNRNCPVTVEKTLVVQNILIATAISANGDGKNDKWYIEPFLFKAELKIVDRKGRTVFEAAPYNDDFTGQGLEEGIYYYDLYLSEVGKRYKGYIHILKH